MVTNAKSCFFFVLSQKTNKRVTKFEHKKNAYLVSAYAEGNCNVVIISCILVKCYVNIFFLLYIIFNSTDRVLSFLMNILPKIPRAVTEQWLCPYVVKLH